MLHRRGFLAALLAMAGSGCTAFQPTQPLRVLVPNAPGGGYDTTARILAGATDGTGPRKSVEVFNLPGGGGMAGLSRLRAERGNPRLIMMMGLGVVGAANVAEQPYPFDDVTPLARLLGEPELLLVRADSGYAGLQELVRAWQRRPQHIRIGGGSVAGGPDHLACYRLAAALDVAVDQVDYNSYDGGGPLLAALLNRQLDAVLTGVLESVDQLGTGSVRALAITSAERIPGLPVPTLRESGLDVIFENWRGVLAPPGLTATQRQQHVELLRAALDTPEWQRAARRNGWTPGWLAGERFSRFLIEENRRTRRLLDRLGVLRDR